MKIVTIANQKGGVGKTTTALNFGAALCSQHGKKVLIIDLDPQANMTEYLGHNIEEGISMTDLLTAFINKGHISESMTEGGIFTNKKNGMDYIPSDLSLANTEQLMVTALSRETILKRMILSQPKFSEYDYIIIDTLPSLGVLMINALAAADGVIIPSQTQKFSADGLESLITLMKQIKSALNPTLELYGILPTMVDNTNVSRATQEKFNKAYSGKVFTTQIHRSIEAAKSAESGTALVRKSTKIGNDYTQFTNEFVKMYE